MALGHTVSQLFGLLVKTGKSSILCIFLLEISTDAYMGVTSAIHVKRVSEDHNRASSLDVRKRNLTVVNGSEGGVIRIWSADVIKVS